jgi:hypothetical protein
VLLGKELLTGVTAVLTRWGAVMSATQQVQEAAIGWFLIIVIVVIVLAVIGLLSLLRRR